MVKQMVQDNKVFFIGTVKYDYDDNSMIFILEGPIGK
jgi:hypothetical protein